MLQFDELMRPDDGTKSDQVLFYFSGFFLLLDELKALGDDAGDLQRSCSCGLAATLRCELHAEHLRGMGAILVLSNGLTDRSVSNAAPPTDMT